MNTFTRAALLALWPIVGWAADAPGPEQFFADPEVQSVSLSPQGKYVAILANLPTGKRVLAVREVADLSKVTLAAASEEDRITDVHWINEDRLGFTYRSHRVDEVGGNYDEFAASRDGSHLVHLISGSWSHAATSTGSHVVSQVLTADYGYGDAMHDGSNNIVVIKYHFNNLDRHPDGSHPFRLDTITGELKDIVPGRSPANVYSWLLDSANTPRIAQSEHDGRCIIYYRAPSSEQWEQLAESGCLENAVMPQFLDGTSALYVTAAHDGYAALYRYDLASRKRDAQPLVSAPGFDFRGAPVIDQGSKRLLGLHLYTDAASTVWFDDEMKRVQKQVDAALPGLSNSIACADTCHGLSAYLVESVSDRQPTEYFLFWPASGKLVGLGGAHPGIAPKQMGMRDFYRFAARDGMQIPAYVTLPPGGASALPAPAVVLVHGGPFLRGVTWDWSAEAQFLAARGYVVIEPEFRGSAGYGYDWFHAGWKQWGGTMQTDLADAANWAVAKGWADRKRIGIMGASYGGYATLMGLIRNPELFRAGVEWAGVTDLQLMFTAANSDASQEALHYSMRTLIGDPDRDAAALAANSPVTLAAQLKQPLLMAHGTEDLRVPLEHATRFRDAVRRTNEHVEWIVYPGEGRGWREAKDRYDFWRRVDAFLDQHLRQAQ